MTEQEMINRINKVEGIGGMTVNERLYICGLMDEFDKSGKCKRIKQILPILYNKICSKFVLQVEILPVFCIFAGRKKIDT